MNVEELQEQTQGEATADYEVLVELPGVQVGATKPALYAIADVRRDTKNGRVILELDGPIE